MLKVATPISALFDDPGNRQQIISESDCLECRDKNINAVYAAQELFHCDLQPIHKLSKDEFHYIEKIARFKPDLKLITFHAASSCDKPHLDGNMFQPAGRQYSRAELLANAKINLSQIKTIFGQQVKIALENNNYYPTEAYQYITDADFLRQLVCENEILFLFDISHAKITSHNKKLNYEDYKNGLPLDKTVQIHISRSAVNGENLAFDSHNIPDAEEWQETKNIISSRHSIEYLTVEYYKDTNNLIKALRNVREIINGLS